MVAAVWLASLFLINPVGNFPLNDDWSFGWSVKHLLQDHEFRPLGWAAMTLWTNVIWGSLFCLPAGFSFTALRISSLAAALLGILGVYWLARQLRQPAWLAALIAATLGFNPIYYALANTFMTDVLFTALIIFSSIYFVKHLQQGGNVNLFLGIIFCVLATLSRQLALAIPLSFGVALILKQGFKTRELVRAGLPTLICGGVLVLFQHWLTVTGRLPALYNFKPHELLDALRHPAESIPDLAYNVYKGMVCLGLYLCPVLLVATAGAWKIQPKRILPLLAGALWVVLFFYFFYQSTGTYMPLDYNIVCETGIGPLALRDITLLQKNIPPALPATFWKTCTCIGMVGAACLITLLGIVLWNLIPKLRHKTVSDGEAAAVFLISAAVIYELPLMLTGNYFDRYLMPAIPLLAAGLVSALPPLPKVSWRVAGPAAMLCTCFALYAVAGTRDYLEWNRVRWRTTESFLAGNHVQPDQMDGGFEFNGQYLFDPNFNQIKDLTKSWWWVHDDEYMISDGPVAGFKPVQESSYTHWMPPYTGKIYVLKKLDKTAGEKSR